MPSPFPGMDPYLETPEIWPDFHNRLASEISVELNQGLPAPYYARLETRLELGVVEDGGGRHRIVPDVVVTRHPRHPAGPGVAVLDRPRRAPSDSIELALLSETVEHGFVEVRDPTRGHKLVTLIEILSPSNKRSGPDREAYRSKQAEILASDASLIEIDLLRAGNRVFPDDSVGATLEGLEPPADYLVLVSRAWKRGPRGSVDAYPCRLMEWLPCLPVPLREGEAAVPLDLQFVVNRAYDGGPYLRGAVDYTRPPTPPLSPADAEWAAALIRERGLGAPA